MKYVGFGRRFVALLVDALVIGLISTVLGFVFGFTNPQQLSNTNTNSLSYGLSLFLSILYWVIYQKWATQTAGKKLLGIKVVDSAGQTPSYFTFFLREIIGKFISGIVIGLGYLWVIWDPKKQGWHDKIANTFVIKV